MAERLTRRGNPPSQDVLNGLSKDVLAETIEVARLHFEKEMTQEEIAKKLDIAQTRVFRRLKLATSAKLVKITVVPPPMKKLEEDLLERLSKRKKIRDVKIVPRGAGENTVINADNLGAKGAEFLEEMVLQHPGDRVKIAMACGRTLLTLLTRFVARLEQSPSVLRKLRNKEITLYPLNLYWGWTFDGNAAIYPAVLVMTTAVLLSRLGIKVLAYTPPPRLSFHRDVESRSDSQDTEARKKYDDYLQDVEQADIFLLGIGTGDSNYKDAVKELRLEHILTRVNIAGELNYQPFTINGEFTPIDNFPGLQANRLQELAKTEKKIIAVAGGLAKASSVLSVLKGDVPFNILLTDEDIAEKIHWV